MKYRIENQADYKAFLYGKIIFAADDLGEGAVERAEKFMSAHRSPEELEQYLIDLGDQHGDSKL